MEQNNTPTAETKMGCCPPYIPPTPCVPPPYYPPRPPSHDTGTAGAIVALTEMYNMLDAKVKTFVDGIPELRTALETETNERTSAVAAVQSAVTAETNERTSADTALSTRIDGNATAIAEAKREIQQERDVRLSTYNDLTDSIHAVRTELFERDEALAHRIDEITGGRDTFIERIANEEAVRATADEQLSARIETVVNESRAKDAVHDTYMQQTNRILGEWRYSENISDKVSGLAVKVDTVERDVSTALSASTQANANVAKCEADIIEIDQGLVTTNQSLDGLESRVAALESGSGGGGGGGGVLPADVVRESRLQEALAAYALKSTVEQMSQLVSALATQNTILQSTVTTLTQKVASLEARVTALEEGGVTPPAPVVVPSVNFSTSSGDKGYKLSVAVDEYGVPTTDITEIAASAAAGSPEGLVFRCVDDGLLYTLKIVELDGDEPTTDISRFTGDASSVAKVYDYIDFSGTDGNAYRLTIVHPVDDDATTDISLKPV